MSAKRILITEVSGECRHLRVNVDPFDNAPGTYCAANPHSDWEKIDESKDCKNCKREKHLVGITRAEAVERMARAMAFVSNITFVSNEQWKVVENGLRISAEAALDALLGGKQ